MIFDILRFFFISSFGSVAFFYMVAGKAVLSKRELLEKNVQVGKVSVESAKEEKGLLFFIDHENGNLLEIYSVPKADFRFFLRVYLVFLPIYLIIFIFSRFF